MKLVFKLTVTGLLILNIVLIIASLGVKYWAKVNSDEDLALYSCSNCGSLKTDWNYECLGRSYCELEGADSQCSLYSDLYKASYSYLILEFCALVLSILFLEKLLLICFDRYPGQRFTIIFTAIFMFIMHLLGTILWFAYSEAGNTCDKTTYTSKPDICYTQGPALAISNCILMSITIISFIILYKPHPNTLIKEFLPGSIWWIPRKLTIWVSISFLSLSIILILASLTIKKWVNNENFTGSLIRCEDCNKVEWLSWTCLKSLECEINSDSATCSDYSELASASSNFVGLQGATFIFISLFIQNLTALSKHQVHSFILANYVKHI